jgi:Zn-dependent protease
MIELKISCTGCGQKYKFDVTPVDGRMPFTVACPVCQLDGTSHANVALAHARIQSPVANAVDGRGTTPAPSNVARRPLSDLSSEGGSPVAETDDGEKVFYRIDSSRFSFREYLWGTKNPLVLLIAGIIKLFRINLGGSTDDPAVQSLRPFEVSELPSEIAAKFEPLARELGSLGFVAPIYHVIEDALNFTKIYWATFRNLNGSALARIHCRTWTKTHPHKFYLFPTFISLHTDGSALFSSAGKPDTLLPRSVKTQHLRGTSATELWRIHETELHKTNKPVHVCSGTGALRDQVEDYHATAREFHLKRGAFRKLAANDQKQVEIIAQARAAATAQTLANADVLAEIELLQKAQANWQTGIWLLVITGIAFFLAGGIQQSFKIALLLIPILLFHELGHYLAMYIFKYRNLRMFFIPFFGAAVTGRKYNIAAWKKVVVSLMGPVPGIVLGCTLAAAGIYRQNDLVVTAAMLCIFINGFNLLPLLPFDGGHVVGTILFSRHRILDSVFRVLTALGILVLAYALQARFLMFIGIVSLLAVRTSFKLAQITEKIREMNLPPPSNDRDDIPLPIADAIVTQLKQKFPKGRNSKQLAEHALAVFETLNSKPPGWAASIFFLLLHVGAFAVAFLGVGFVTLYQQGGLGGGDFGLAPRLKIDSTMVEVRSPGPDAGLEATNAVAVVAHFRKKAQAREAFDAIGSGLPEQAEALLFANTTFFRLPATNMALRTQVFEQCSTRTTNVFIERTNYAVTLSFTFKVPETGADTNWLKEFGDFWKLPHDFQPIPPWCPEPLTSAEKRPDYTRARHSYSLLISGNYSSTPERDTAETAAMDLALRTGDTETFKKLQDKIRAAAEKAREASIARIRTLPETEIHRGVLDVYMDYPSDTNALPAFKASQTKLAELAGTLKDQSGPARRYGIMSGYESINKRGVTLYAVQFTDFLHGGPELVRWLEAHGAKEMRYDLIGSLIYTGTDPEEE